MKMMMAAQARAQATAAAIHVRRGFAAVCFEKLFTRVTHFCVDHVMVKTAGLGSTIRRKSVKISKSPPLPLAARQSRKLSLLT